MKKRILYLFFLFGAITGLIAQGNFSLEIQNLGNFINSQGDEYLPVIYNDTLYFRRLTGKGLNKKNQIFAIPVKAVTCPPQHRISPIELYDIKNVSNSDFETIAKYNHQPAAPSFFKFEQNKLRYMSDAKKIEKINSNFNDLHPAISPDGSMLIFASDRAGDNSQTDLWISFRGADGNWSSPKRDIGVGINTGDNEISPYIAANGSLYYSSKGFIRDSVEMYYSGKEKSDQSGKSDVFIRTERQNYNIIVAEPVPGQRGKWRNPKVLPYPINTEFDEIGPALWRDSIIFFSSDRASLPFEGFGDNYGGFDIYGKCWKQCPNCYDTCTPTVIIAKINNSCGRNFSYNGKIFLKNSRGKLINSYLVPNSGLLSISVPLPYNEDYMLELEHPCFERNMSANFTVECNKAPLILPADCSSIARFDTIYKDVIFKLDNNCQPKAIDFPDISYFVTGYYKPANFRNLNNLKIDITLGRLGKTANNGTEYISDPNNDYDRTNSRIDYDKLASSIQGAIERIANNLKEWVNYSQLMGKKVEVTINGYSDERGLRGNPALYNEETINLAKAGVISYQETPAGIKRVPIVEKGTEMDNYLLSMLRAYYTQQLIADMAVPESKNIKWRVVGKGTTNSDNSYLRNRKVEIKYALIDE